ncbi:MAG TPA: adenine phosphoribosyltransferase [Polyangia bacterium]|nr:adenine phosphoribosyltransferase [Polyangia bacterium]
MPSDPRVAEITRLVRDIPDFPKPGILFKDITPVLANGAAFRQTTALLAERVRERRPEVLVGIESRGFLFGAALAHELELGLLPVRKPGKLPWRTRRVEYALEYGTDALEMHADAVAHGTRVVIVDDLLATGGTAAATARLVEEQGGLVAGFAFVIELDFLGGRQKLGGRPVDTLIHY